MYNKHMQIGSDQGSSQRGAVSIFLVIFFALLISVITVSFVSIVIRDTVQSTNNDLSRSAYDSAQAGVEDGKRAIADYANAGCIANPSGPTCSVLGGYFSSTDCTKFIQYQASKGAVAPGSAEVPIQSSTNAAFNQAYTCVNVIMDTPDYVGNKTAYSSDIIPLRSTPLASFDGIQLNWFTHTDGGLTDTQPFTLRTVCSNTPATGSNCSLPAQGSGNWTSDTPALMRVELISYTGAISDSQLQATSRTLFLYPTGSGVSSVSFDDNVQPPSAANGAPIIPVRCQTTGDYACKITISLGATVGTTRFLRVTPVYKASTFQLELTSGGSTGPLLNGVQPILDSTGRANDLFRRVQARVRLQNNVLYPEYAVDVQNSFCKNFSVGSLGTDFHDFGC